MSARWKEKYLPWITPWLSIFSLASLPSYNISLGWWKKCQRPDYSVEKVFWSIIKTFHYKLSLYLYNEIIFLCMLFIFVKFCPANLNRSAYHPKDDHLSFTPNSCRSAWASWHYQSAHTIIVVELALLISWLPNTAPILRALSSARWLGFNYSSSVQIHRSINQLYTIHIRP